MDFWNDVYVMHARNRRRRQLLDEMIEWRNAIRHQDFDKPGLKGRTEIHLPAVRRYRSVCGALAGFFDAAALAHINAVAGPTLGW
jgi:hypothetical protein